MRQFVNYPSGGWPLASREPTQVRFADQPVLGRLMGDGPENELAFLDRGRVVTRTPRGHNESV